MFGINGWEFVVLAIVALVVIGPDKLPKFIQDAGRIVRQVRSMATQAQNDVREHLGPEFAELDLSDLNPRSFVQKHLLDDGLDEDLRAAVRFDLDDLPTERAKSDRTPSPDFTKKPENSGSHALAPDDRPPFDADAT